MRKKPDSNYLGYQITRKLVLRKHGNWNSDVCMFSFVGHLFFSCHQACVWAESVNCTVSHPFHQVFRRRSLNNAHTHHFASSFPPSSLWTKKQEQIAAPASITKDELLLPLSLSLMPLFSLSCLFFLPVSRDLLVCRETNKNTKNWTLKCPAVL